MKERKTAFVDTSLCVACGTCVKICPMSAIFIVCGCHAAVQSDRCVGCGRCSKACPASVIKLIQRGEEQKTLSGTNYEN